MESELEALPVLSVVLGAGDEYRSAYQKYETGHWFGDGRSYETGQIELPATVLWSPADRREMSEDEARQIAHAEAMCRYGPVPDYVSLPYEQVVAFERGAAWQRDQASLVADRSE